MNVVVYCGASGGKNDRYRYETISLGKIVAKYGHTLVYGGGNTGLMGSIADSVLEHNGKVIGIIPEFLKRREVAHKKITQLITVETMSERKAKMISLGEFFIALPGGIGTMEEISEVLSLYRLGKIAYPCVFFNIDGYYDTLKQFYQNMVDEGFLSEEDFSNIHFFTTVDDFDRFFSQKL